MYLVIMVIRVINFYSSVYYLFAFEIIFYCAWLIIGYLIAFLLIGKILVNNIIINSLK